MPVTVSRRAWMIGGAVAVVVVLAVVLIVVLNPGGGGSGVRLSAPSYIADPVPKAKPLTADRAPKRCGVATSTLRTYVPSADDLGDDGDTGAATCDWYSLNGGAEHCPGFCPTGDGDRERRLKVVIGRPGEPTDPGGASPDGDALRDLDPADALLVTAGSPERKVDALGDEALYHYSPAEGVTSDTNEGAELRFRTGATVVTVSYTGGDFSDDGPKRQVAEKEARPAVLAAAADVARALHVPARPVIGPVAPAAIPPPAPRTVHPCDLVPHDLVNRLAEGAVHRRAPAPATGVAAPYGQARDACEWDADPTCCLGADTDKRPERHLIVTVYAESEWRRGIAVAQATRLYLERHDDERAAALSDFHAVRGLGDQAFAAYGALQPPSGTAGGHVGFRYRDVVVDVDYTGARDSSVTPDEHPLDKRAAVNGAYTAAAAVLEALR